VDIGCFYLGQDMIVSVWAAVSMSGYECVCVGWLRVGQDSRMRIWAG
jgi:hypothetical protein